MRAASAVFIAAARRVRQPGAESILILAWAPCPSRTWCRQASSGAAAIEAVRERSVFVVNVRKWRREEAEITAF